MHLNIFILTVNSHHSLCDVEWASIFCQSCNWKWQLIKIHSNSYPASWIGQMNKTAVQIHFNINENSLLLNFHFHLFNPRGHWQKSICLTDLKANVRSNYITISNFRIDPLAYTVNANLACLLLAYWMTLLK